MYAKIFERLAEAKRLRKEENLKQALLFLTEQIEGALQNTLDHLTFAEFINDEHLLFPATISYAYEGIVDTKLETNGLVDQVLELSGAVEHDNISSELAEAIYDLHALVSSGQDGLEKAAGKLRDILSKIKLATS